MRKIPNKKISELWPLGPEALLEEWKNLGFKTTSLSLKTQNLLLKSWKLLEKPRSSDISESQSSEYTFLLKQGKLLSKNWGLVISDPSRLSELEGQGIACLGVEAPDAALDFILRKTYLKEWSGPSTSIPSGIEVEAGLVLGPESQIGEGTILESNVRIGARVSIGRHCRIGSGSRIADDSIIGDHCEFTASVSIGGQGFGFVKYPNEKYRRPRLHVGRVILGDRVRLGAFVSIDRGVFEDTQIGSDSALDNIVQIAHNCSLGESATLCSFVGLSGSTFLGDRVTVAGMVGTKGHVKIGHDVTIAAQSGISHDIEDGLIVKGYPPRPLNKALKIQALVEKLPEFYERLKDLENKR